jgi:hypothetical protein
MPTGELPGSLPSLLVQYQCRALRHNLCIAKLCSEGKPLWPPWKPARRANPATDRYPTMNVGMLPPPALTLMTELREQRVTAPDSSPAT